MLRRLRTPCLTPTGMSTALRRRFSTALQPEVETQKMTMVAAINDALRIAMQTDDTAVLFGEDVAFGGVRRASSGPLGAQPLVA